MGMTSISIDEQVRDRLRALSVGSKNYTEALTRLLDEIEMDRYVDRLQREIDDPDQPWLDGIEWE